MADILSSAGERHARRGNARALSGDGTDAHPDLVTLVELLFFAYRDFTADADEILLTLGFGRAHHRVLHFVNRNPDLRVADLLLVLRITKQSLARVLRQLVGEGYIEQTAGARDRRERRLQVTAKGRELSEQLLHLQTRRIATALQAAGSEARSKAEAFLLAMVEGEDRPAVEQLIGLGTSDRFVK